MISKSEQQTEPQSDTTSRGKPCSWNTWLIMRRKVSMAEANLGRGMKRPVLKKWSMTIKMTVLPMDDPQRWDSIAGPHTVQAETNSWTSLSIKVIRPVDPRMTREVQRMFPLEDLQPDPSRNKEAASRTGATIWPANDRFRWLVVVRPVENQRQGIRFGVL